MRNQLFTKTFEADGAIAPYRLVKFGAADGTVAAAAAAADKVIGTTDLLGADAAGDRVDVVLAGIAEIEYGGTITRGDWLVSDATGKAIASAPSAGANHQVIGRAMVSGISGDIGSAFLTIGQNQG